MITPTFTASTGRKGKILILLNQKKITSVRERTGRRDRRNNGRRI
jgi:hypothetical protein